MSHPTGTSIGRGEHLNFSNLRCGTCKPSDFTWARLHHGMRDCLPFGCSPLRLGQRLDMGHVHANLTAGCRHQIYYHHVSSKIVKKMRGRLTHDHDILAGLLVALALAADLVGETAALMLEGLTPLTCQNAHHQLILNREDQ